MAAILIAGAIGVGKSTVARALSDRLDLQLVVVRDALASVVGAGLSRKRLQEEGAALDRRTNGRWLVDYLTEHADLRSGLVLDSLRTVRQAVPVREDIPGALLVYLDGSLETRLARFRIASAADPVKRSMDFSSAMEHETERAVGALRSLADLVLDTDGVSSTAVVEEIVRLVDHNTSG